MRLTSEVPIAQFATRADSIEESQPLTQVGTITLGRGFEEPQLGSPFRHRERSVTLRNYRLENVHLDAGTMTILRNGSAKENLLELPSTVEYIMALGFPNYYQWLVQTVPAIDWSLRNIPDRRIVLLCGMPLNTWQIETLALLGHDGVQRVALDDQRSYSIRTINVSEFQTGATELEVSRVAQASFDRLSEASHANDTVADIVYVARTDTRNRIVDNEAEIIRLLEAEGVFVAVPGSLSVSQQISLFRSAKAVIGPHGGGLTNIVFCRPGTIVYELMPDWHRNPRFNVLAQSAGLDYRVDLYPTTRAAEVDKTPTWTIDPDIFLKRLQEIKDDLRARFPNPIRVSAMGFLKGLGPAHQAPTDQLQPPRQSWLRRLWRS